MDNALQVRPTAHTDLGGFDYDPPRPTTSSSPSTTSPCQEPQGGRRPGEDLVVRDGRVVTRAPSRPLEEIEADIPEVEAEILKLLGEVAG